MINVASKNIRDSANPATVSKTSNGGSSLESPDKDLFQAEIQNLKKLRLPDEVTDLTVQIARFFERPVAALQLLIKWAPSFPHDVVEVAKGIIAECESLKGATFNYAYLQNALRPKLVRGEFPHPSHLSNTASLPVFIEGESVVTSDPKRLSGVTDRLDILIEKAAEAGVRSSRLYRQVSKWEED